MCHKRVSIFPAQRFEKSPAGWEVRRGSQGTVGLERTCWVVISVHGWNKSPIDMTLQVAPKIPTRQVGSSLLGIAICLSVETRRIRALTFMLARGRLQAVTVNTSKRDRIGKQRL